ncbi:MAG: hypothetical protein KGK33_04495 [Hyphomicrobiales bacterium]|nr:hypothetical protein [Hyphomicrobiales bacterium]MDE1971747.1 hypothetical protein [Hyphomicrobiales bacterium]MDE2283857.1 hypothetical protein [Hyphomicrobiales bacterium]MDE2373226.1 hypothetical protein [Hyphomicrobiales bacterium]
MSTKSPAGLVGAPDTALVSDSRSNARFEAAVAVLFAATAVLFVSFVAVMTGIV